MYFKDQQNNTHWLDDVSFIHLLPNGSVEITEEEANIINSPPKPLSVLKDEKNLEINASRLSANLTTFTHSGKVFACDQLSRSDIDAINGRVATRGSLPNDWVGGWKAIDNTYVAIETIEQWNEFYDSMVAQGQANFAKSQSLKAQLAAATTAEQVSAIQW
ncbi:DUF4376 domain-containing protein [Methylotenera sp.]|uniref:DUF4376 domain-containing protein n=1 Tax=Methylotenera sp. TaxID=2051956 RepID=UPI002ED9AC7D